jgi:hypothetical protein
MPVAEPVSRLDRPRTPPVQSTARPKPKLVKGETTTDSPTPMARLFTIALVGLTIWLAYKIATKGYYTPRSNFGFYLGVVGSVMMLFMMGYPLRKHVRFMQSWGALKNWFRLHMIMGIVGPTLILFHSTFHLRSMNATIALFSMLGVVISGIIGRFVYTKIHYGLYGRRATLEKVRADFAGQSSEAKSRLHFAPRVEQWLQSFERDAMQLDRSFTSHLLSPLTIGLSRILLTIRCAFELRRAMKTSRYPEFPGGVSEATRLTSSYLKECERVAQFSTYERLFSLWHVLHVPLIYILAATAVFHIISVYMY